MKLTPEAQDRYHKQDYARRGRIEGVELIELRRFNDDGGSMTELARLGAGRIEGLDGFEVAQINYSTVEPGVIKAFHLHLRQTDIWYVPPEDRVLLVLVDQRQDSATRGQRMRLVLGDGNSRLVRVPPGVAHGCRNISGRTARILYLTDVHFSSDPEQCDEGRLPWDMFGAELWDVARE